MANIILNTLFISFILCVISCVSPVVNPVESRRVGTYKAKTTTLQKKVLQIEISANGSFGMSYENTNATTSASENFLVNATNISGLDPNYSFQNSKGAGTLKFISEDRVVVTFRKLVPDYFIIGETTCFKQP